MHFISISHYHLSLPVRCIIDNAKLNVVLANISVRSGAEGHATAAKAQHLREAPFPANGNAMSTAVHG
jgi:hypothetical protein